MIQWVKHPGGTYVARVGGLRLVIRRTMRRYGYTVLDASGGRLAGSFSTRYCRHQLAMLAAGRYLQQEHPYLMGEQNG